jgi:hypothetical protein
VREIGGGEFSRSSPMGVRQDFLAHGKRDRHRRQSPFLENASPTAVPAPVGTPRDRQEISPHTPMIDTRWLRTEDGGSVSLR